MSNTSIIAQVLSKGITIKTKSAARVTGDKVGLDTFTKWQNALEVARKAFYEYEWAKDYNAKVIANGKTPKDMKPFKTSAHNALQALLDIIGEVNGRTLTKSDELLDCMAKCAVADKDVLVGEAFTVDSQIKNYSKQIRDGGNAEYIADLEEKKTAAEESLRLLKKTEGSAKPEISRVTLNTFKTKAEKKMGEVIAEVLAKTPEQLDAEEAAKAAEKKARRAERQKTRRAEAKKTEATAK